MSSKELPRRHTHADRRAMTPKSGRRHGPDVVVPTSAAGNASRLLALAIAAALPAAASAGPPGLRNHADVRIFPAWVTSGTATSATHSPQSPAQVRVVTNCDDAGPGSLRDTLAAAGTGDAIDLTGLACGSIQLSSGVLEIPANNIQLLGPGAATLAIDGGGTDRVLIDPYGFLTISGLTIRNGADRSSGFNLAGGGCIAMAGEVQLIDSVVSGCLAAGEGAYGGALYAYALTMQRSVLADNTAYGYLPGTGTAANGGGAFVYQASIQDSTISGNVASHYPDAPRSYYDVGGGIMVVRGGVIENSTFSNNRAGSRGGAINSLGPLAVSNSTLAENTCLGGRGGALYLRGKAHLSLNNATISANQAAEGGGVHLGTDAADITSNIVYGNRATSVADSDNWSATTALVLKGNHNLVGVGYNGLTLPADTLAADPLLRSLGDYGGATRTMALTIGSPALDAGSNPFQLPYDQRGPGHARVLGPAADIGAFEGAVAPPAIPVPALQNRFAMVLAGLVFTLGLYRPRTIRARRRLRRGAAPRH
ncbi:MAG TPA: right-handed parallel beta-helix repeat-containing protein [Rhodanobacteraceae bacterium]|nr:right-handed parallel beta-helix repeat-containing protein [Rhodanobacteraceae bacterium]